MSGSPLEAFVTLCRPAGMGLDAITTSVEKSLPPIAGILLIVSAGGGFKQTLVDSGVAEVITDFAADSNMSVLLLGWLVARHHPARDRIATVATVTAAGFWLVKERFGLTVGQNIKTWSVMETVISVVGIVLVLLVGLVI